MRTPTVARVLTLITLASLAAPRSTLPLTFPIPPTAFLSIVDRSAIENSRFQPVYFARIGQELQIDAGVNGQTASGVGDLYVSVQLPTGHFASFVGDPQHPSAVVGPARAPLLLALGFGAGSSFPMEFRHTFAGPEPRGFYLVQVLLVQAGRDAATRRTG